MTQVLIWFAVGGGLLCIVVGTVALYFRRSEGTTLRRASQDERVFCKRPAQRVGCALIGLSFLIGPFIGLSWGWDAVFMFAVLWVPFGILMLWLAAPDELHLNLKERTYHRVSGWRFCSKSRSGGWSGIWGVYVEASNSTYYVGVRGVGLGGRMDLGCYGNVPEAEQFAEQLSDELSLPRVPPPNPWRVPYAQGKNVTR